MRRFQNLPSIRLLLADDHAIFRTGVKASLADIGKIAVVAEAGDGDDAVAAALTLKPDVVVLDVDMPRMSGLDAGREIRRSAPSTKIVLLTVHDDPHFARAAMATGVSGYALKDDDPAELVSAIHAVVVGNTYVSPKITRGLLTDPRPPAGESLSPRELDVLKLLASGHRNKEIATRLSLGVRTIETYRFKLMRKLNIDSVAGLTAYAISRGILDAPKRLTLR